MTEPTIQPLSDADTVTALAELDTWDELRTAGAVSTDAAPAVDRAITAVTAAIAAEPRRATAPAPTAARRDVRRLAVAGALVAAVTAAALVLPALVRAPSASAEAAGLLTRAADSITASDPATRPGQWWRLTTTGFALSMNPNTNKDDAPATDAAWLVGRTRTTYVAVDGTRPTWFVDGPASPRRQVAGAADGDAPTLDPGVTWTTDLAPSTTTATWQSPSPSFLAALPRDTSALRDRLYADSGSSGRSSDGEAFVYVADVLRSGLVPADLRAALYRVLATVPGVEITASDALVDGVPGVAIGRFEDVDGTRQEIVIDPRDGALVGEREIAVTELDGIAAGTVVLETRTVRTVVDEVPSDVVARATVSHCTSHDDGRVDCQAR